MATKVITDPVSKQQFSRDDSDPNSIYSAYTPPVQTATQVQTPAAPVTPPGAPTAPAAETNAPVVKAPTNTTTVGGVDYAADSRAALQKTQADYDKQAKKVQNTMNSITNGSTPLTPEEDAQVKGLQQQFTALIENQKLSNIGAQGAANTRGYQTGAGEYDNSFQVKTIGAIVSAGTAKVADLQVKEAAAVGALTTAFRNNKLSQVKVAWDTYQEAFKERQSALQTMIDDTAKAIKEAADAQAKADEAAAKIEAEVVKTRNDVLMKLATSGNKVTPEVMAAVQNARTSAEAISAAGGNLYSESERLDAQYKKAQIAKAYSDIASNQGGAGGMDAASVIAYANEYAATGKIPSGLPKGTFGLVAQVAKELPKSNGQILSVSTGVNPTGDTTLQTGLSSLYSATELAKQLKALDEKRWGGVIAGTIGGIFGSEDQQRYMDLRSQVVDLLSRARSGAALTPSEEARYGDMLPGRFDEPFGIGADSDVRIDNFINTLTSDAKNKASSQGWAINGVSEVNLNGHVYKVGDIIENEAKQKGRVNADGSITYI